MSVYFAQVGPHIKIGFSRNPERRVRRLFASATRYDLPPGTPTDLASRHLIRYIDGDLGTERAVHVALEDFSLGNEWFADEPQVRDFIANVETATYYEPVPRPGGPVIDWMDPFRGMTDAEIEQYQRAIDNLFAGTSIAHART